jgi:hypothetical protein
MPTAYGACSVVRVAVVPPVTTEQESKEFAKSHFISSNWRLISSSMEGCITKVSRMR